MVGTGLIGDLVRHRTRLVTWIRVRLELVRVRNRFSSIGWFGLSIDYEVWVGFDWVRGRFGGLGWLKLRIG